jgi:hypothetical protein
LSDIVVQPTTYNSISRWLSPLLFVLRIGACFALVEATGHPSALSADTPMDRLTLVGLIATLCFVPAFFDWAAMATYAVAVFMLGYLMLAPAPDGGWQASPYTPLVIYGGMLLFSASLGEALWNRRRSYPPPRNRVMALWVTGGFASLMIWGGASTLVFPSYGGYGDSLIYQGDAALFILAGAAVSTAVFLVPCLPFLRHVTLGSTLPNCDLTDAALAFSAGFLAGPLAYWSYTDMITGGLSPWAWIGAVIGFLCWVAFRVLTPTSAHLRMAGGPRVILALFLVVMLVALWHSIFFVAAPALGPVVVGVLGSALFGGALVLLVRDTAQRVREGEVRKPRLPKLPPGWFPPTG